MLFGYDTANISGVLGMKKFVQDYGNAVPTGTIGGNIFVVDGQTYQITAKVKSLVTSTLSIGTFLGALSTAPIADHLGRRAGLLLASLIFVVGVVIQTAVKSLAGALSLARRADLSGMYAGRSVKQLRFRR